jgi:hypothetical protein
MGIRGSDIKTVVTDILSRSEELSKTNYYHEILVKAPDMAACKTRMLKFFENYQLVRYSGIHINESIPASDPGFSSRLVKAVDKNRQILHNLIKELQQEDVNTLDDLEGLPQGYKSKMLHVITHFLDGFFGIDTYFYNLEEYSHWVSDKQQKSIESASFTYWLLAVEAKI